MPELNKTELELRADFRERVSAAARQGRRPQVHFDGRDLRWAFAGDHAAELEQLERTAMEAIEARAHGRRRRGEEREVRALADRIESDWAEQERRERRGRAEAEARRQLGLEDA